MAIEICFPKEALKDREIVEETEEEIYHNLLNPNNLKTKSQEGDQLDLKNVTTTTNKNPSDNGFEKDGMIDLEDNSNKLQ